jgi:hypothetical protein
MTWHQNDGLVREPDGRPTEGGDMTEKEWLACTDPKKILKFLRRKASERKLRLFAVACARRVEHLPYRGISAEESDKARAADRHALAVAERFADNLASAAELKVAMNSTTTNSAGRACTRAKAFLSAEASADTFYRYIALKRAEWASEARAQANLLRCVCGNPFRPIALSRDLLTWQRRTIPRLAQTIYDDRAFDRLLIVADALEEAGCTDPAILKHCRQPGERVRGCWVIDALLGKS